MFSTSGQDEIHSGIVFLKVLRTMLPFGEKSSPEEYICNGAKSRMVTFVEANRTASLMKATRLWSWSYYIYLVSAYKKKGYVGRGYQPFPFPALLGAEELLEPFRVYLGLQANGVNAV